MRKNRLFALAFGVLLVAALVVQPANAQTNKDQTDEGESNGVHGFFFGAGMSNGFFNSKPMDVYSDFEILKLSPLKLGVYYEMPLGIGNFFAGLEGGFASGSNFGGGGGVDFLPVNFNATFAFNIADILFIGPGVKAGVLGLLGQENYKVLPLLGAGLDLELRYRYFPLSIYAQGGIIAYPSSYKFSILPTVEAGIRIPRGAFGRGGAKEEASASTLTAQTEPPAAPLVPPVTAPPAPTVTSLTVNPAIVTVNQGATQQFTAIVEGTNNPPQTVTWSVIGASAGTSISPAGLLSVGPNQTPGALTVRATSTADTTKSAVAVVTVPAPAPSAGFVAPPVTTPAPTVTGVVVNPFTTVVPQGLEQHFTAIVEGTNNPPQTVTWSVTGASAGTSINQNGLLIVGQNQPAGTLTVRATSTADTTKSGTATVTVPVPALVVPPPVTTPTQPAVPTVTNVTVIPGIITVPQGSTQQFSANVTGTNNPPQTVTWSVSGGAAGTSISPNGLLTVGANQPAGNLTVRATSTADTSRSGTAAVTVPAPPPAQVVPPPATTPPPVVTPPPATTTPPPVVTAPPVTTPPVTTPPPAAVTPPPAPVSGRRDITDTSKQSLFAEIHFEPDTAFLIESTRPQLDAAGRYLQANPNLWVLVRTYTAPFGTASGRFMVALDRARFCRDYLIQRYGISADRIVIETLASEKLPENVVIEEWITYRTAELIMISE